MTTEAMARLLNAVRVGATATSLAMMKEADEKSLGLYGDELANGTLNCRLVVCLTTGAVTLEGLHPALDDWRPIVTAPGPAQNKRSSH